MSSSSLARAPRARTIGALVDELATLFGDREALVGSGQRYTYRELQQAVHQFSRGLLALGVEPGDKVAVVGASGNVGKLVTLRLSDSFKVTGISRNPSRVRDFLPADKVELCQADLDSHDLSGFAS